MSINQQTLRESQLIMLEMLIEFDAICEKYHLIYWLDSGTTLGVVRHQGFIPWDDDIDISMPQEDYKKFAQIAKNELSKNIFFQNTQTDKNFPFDYMKLRSTKATIIEFHEVNKKIKYHQGLFIDIFPMLTVKNSIFYLWYYKNIFKLIRMLSAKKLNFILLRSFFIWTLDKMHQGWEKEDLKVIYSAKMPDIAASFEIKKIFPLKKMLFEGIHFYMPNSPQHYLENIYSFNYMELPSPEKRMTHAEEIKIMKDS